MGFHGSISTLWKALKVFSLLAVNARSIKVFSIDEGY